MSDASQKPSSDFTVDLREVNDDDHEWLVELHNDPVVLYNLTNPKPVELHEHKRWWKGIKNSNTEVRLVFTVNGVRAGFCKFYQIDRNNFSCVLGADLHKDFRGRGLATPMWHLMLEACFGGWDLHRVSLTTAEYNKVAQRVYKKVGFKEEGRLVQSLKRGETYYDQIAMYLLRDDWLQRQV